LYGELDGGIPQSIVQDFEHQLAAQGTEHEFHTYADAQHAFFNDERPSFHPEASADAWQRSLAWLRKYLA
jgi:carboxymethylenebutenolidase